MNHQSYPVRFALAALATGLMLAAPVGVQADTLYKVERIVRSGDKVGDITLLPAGDIEVGALNDNGQIVIIAENAAEGAGEVILQYSDSKLTPLMVGGGNAPGGTWSKEGVVYGPITMNARGDVAFAADLTVGGETTAATFRWDFAAQKSDTVAAKGMAAPDGLTFEVGGLNNAAINDNGEIVFPAAVRNAAGALLPGLFFRGQDNTLRTVVLAGQELPGGGRAQQALLPTINAAGAVAVLVQRPGELFSAYLWENGGLTPIALVGAEAPGGAKIRSAGSASVNSKDRSVLVTLLLEGSNLFGLYRFAEGKLTPVLLPGQAIPGAGTFRTLLFPAGLFPAYAISTGNNLGQHAFVAAVTEGTATRLGAFLLEPDGTVRPIIKTGDTTPDGAITAVGPPSAQPSSGIALNNKGQVAVPVKIGTGPATLVLLTPPPAP